MKLGMKQVCFAVSVALILLPTPGISDQTLPRPAESSISADSPVRTSKLPINAGDEAPLSLSLSLSLSSPGTPALPGIKQQEIETALSEEASGEALALPLSLSLSYFSTNLIEEKPQLLGIVQERDAVSRQSLFGDFETPAKVSPSTAVWKQLVTGWRGFSQLELADNYSNPEHFSKFKLRTELSRTGQFNEHIKWKVSGRFDYDAVYDLSSFYPEPVRDNQRAQFFVRENYLDMSAGDFDFRLGRQHVIWGEMVGLFFADVVSAKDLREFLLPAFDIMRIPQWAIRGEYSKNDMHAEVLWIPIPTLDEIGKPGADYYPGPLRETASFLNEDRSGRNVANSNYGFRLSQLKNGWDLSAFYYHSLDASSTFYRVSALTEPLVFQPRHDKIDQAGGTVTKDFGSVVFKGEWAYTDGRKFNTSRPSAVDGLVRQNTLDYALGLDFSLPLEARLNVQFFQRVFFKHDPDSFTDSVESGGSVLLAGKVWRNIEAQTLLISSFNRSDWMFRPRLSWNFERNWRWAVGADIFGGGPTGFFGRFDHNDRVYTELRYSF
jgi:hypothetical protein